MINIVLTGIGGQGTVLSAKVLAQAACAKGWQVRTAETIGMSQRGGSVISHVRLGNRGEEVYSPLVPAGTAQLIIAFEPAEAARCIKYLAPDGVVVSARTVIQPVTVALKGADYHGDVVLNEIRKQLGPEQRLVIVEDKKLLGGKNTKALNMVLLAKALEQNCVPLSVDDLREAVRVCVKPQFVAMNISAIDFALEYYDY